MGDAPAKSGVPKARDSPHASLARYRKKGEKILHSKYIIICVIILTIIDCALVIAQLILDLYSVKKTLAQSERRVDGFVEQLQSKYQQELSGDGEINVDNLFHTILDSTIMWNFTSSAHVPPQAASSAGLHDLHLQGSQQTSGTHSTLTFAEAVLEANQTEHGRQRRENSHHVGRSVAYLVSAHGKTLATAAGASGSVSSSRSEVMFRALRAGVQGLMQTNLTDNLTAMLDSAPVPGSTDDVSSEVGYSHLGGRPASQHLGYLFHTSDHVEHDPQIEIAHKCHYASLAVVTVLLIEVILKILCSGSHFVKRKIEVFDAVIILASFVVDLVFLKGLQAFPIDDSIFILAFLLPWRVIRVVNSLVVAVIDHEHVKLRLLYSRKKKLDKTVENLRNEVDELKGLLQDVRSFCVKEGLEAWKIDNLLGKFAPRRRKDSKFYTLVKLVMSTASVADDKDSVSSSSIENDIRAIANRDSVLNINDCSNSNENTVTSFNFLSVPGSYDSRSISEVDSYKGGYSSRSPSPSPLNISPDPSPCITPSGDLLRVPSRPPAFRFDETQSLGSEGMTSRPCTPNILLTAPSMEMTVNAAQGVAETNFGGVPDVCGEGGRDSEDRAGVKGEGGGALSVEKTAPTPPVPVTDPLLCVPNNQGRSRISDSHSLTDLQEVRDNTSRRPSCLSLNADAKGRHRKSPRRVNFDLS